MQHIADLSNSQIFEKLTEQLLAIDTMVDLSDEKFARIRSFKDHKPIYIDANLKKYETIVNDKVDDFLKALLSVFAFDIDFVNDFVSKITGIRDDIREDRIWWDKLSTNAMKFVQQFLEKGDIKNAHAMYSAYGCGCLAFDATIPFANAAIKGVDDWFTHIPDDSYNYQLGGQNKVKAVLEDVREFRMCFAEKCNQCATGLDDAIAMLDYAIKQVVEEEIVYDGHQMPYIHDYLVDIKKELLLMANAVQ